MAYNNGFPMAYPQMYSNPYQPFTPPQAPTQQTQTRVIEVVPVDTEAAAASFPVAMGATQVMFAKDDSFIAVKSMSVNGQSAFDVYVRRPPAPPEPVFDPGEYVRKDELPALVQAAVAAHKEVDE